MKDDRILYVVCLSDFLPDSICSVYFDAASDKSRRGTNVPGGILGLELKKFNHEHESSEVGGKKGINT